MRLLLAEDDPTLGGFLVQGLTEAGYAVDAVADGEEAVAALGVVPYDVAILDVNLPGCDGFEVCRRVRARPGAGAGAGAGPAILFLTARDAVADRVAGLDAGAEDYLVKPFAFAELLARVRALLRRGPGAAALLRAGDVELDPAGRSVHRGGEAIRLTAKEFALLEYLMRSAGRVVTKAMIAEHVWNFDLEGESNFIEVYVYALRKKLGAAGGGQVIETVRGVGYRVDGARRA